MTYFPKASSFQISNMENAPVSLALNLGVFPLYFSENIILDNAEVDLDSIRMECGWVFGMRKGRTECKSIVCSIMIPKLSWSRGAQES